MWPDGEGPEGEAGALPPARLADEQGLEAPTGRLVVLGPVVPPSGRLVVLGPSRLVPPSGRQVVPGRLTGELRTESVASFDFRFDAVRPPWLLQFFWCFLSST